MRSLYHLTFSDSKEACCSQRNLGLCDYFDPNITQKFWSYMHTQKRESYFPFRLRKTVIRTFFSSNLKWELQEAPSLSIKAATLRIKIFQRNVSAQVINSWGWALNKPCFNSSLLAHLCSASVTPANTSHSPELLFQSLPKHQGYLLALLFLLPGVPPFTTQLVHNQHLALQTCCSLCYQCWHFQRTGQQAHLTFSPLFSHHWLHSGRWETCTLHLPPPWLVHAVCILGNASGG